MFPQCENGYRHWNLVRENWHFYSEAYSNTNSSKSQGGDDMNDILGFRAGGNATVSDLRCGAEPGQDRTREDFPDFNICDKSR